MDFFIQGDQGDRIFKVDHTSLQTRDTLVFRDMHGNELCGINMQKLRVKDTMEVEAPDGEIVAHIRKERLTSLRDRYEVNIGNGPTLNVQGNILDYEYRITNNLITIARISKKWFRMRDSYGVEIGPGQNDIVLLAAAMCIDQMSGSGE